MKVDIVEKIEKELLEERILSDRIAVYEMLESAAPSFFSGMCRYSCECIPLSRNWTLDRDDCELWWYAMTDAWSGSVRNAHEFPDLYGTWAYQDLREPR